MRRLTHFLVGPMAGSPARSYLPADLAEARRYLERRDFLFRLYGAVFLIALMSGVWFLNVDKFLLTLGCMFISLWSLMNLKQLWLYAAIVRLMEREAEQRSK